MSVVKTLLLTAALADLLSPVQLGAEQSVKISGGLSKVLRQFFAENETVTIKKNEAHTLYAAQNHEFVVLNGDKYPLEKLFKTDLMIDFDKVYKADTTPAEFHRATFVNKLLLQAKEDLKLAGNYAQALIVFKKNTDTFNYFTPLLLQLLNALNQQKMWNADKIGELFDILMCVPQSPQTGLTGDYVPSTAADADMKVTTYKKSYLEHTKVVQWWETSATCAIAYSEEGYKGESHIVQNSDAMKLSELSKNIAQPKSIHTEPGCSLVVYDKYSVKKVSTVIPYSVKTIDWVGTQCTADVSCFSVDVKCVNMYKENTVDKLGIVETNEITSEKYFECKCYPTLREKKEKFLIPVYKQQVAYYKKKEPEVIMVISCWGFTGLEKIVILGETHSLPKGEWYQVKVPVSAELTIKTLNLNQNALNQVLVASPQLHKLRFQGMKSKCVNGKCRALSGGLLTFDDEFEFSVKQTRIVAANVIHSRMHHLEYLNSDSTEIGVDVENEDEDVIDEVVDQDQQSNSYVALLFSFLL